MQLRATEQDDGGSLVPNAPSVKDLSKLFSQEECMRTSAYVQVERGGVHATADEHEAWVAVLAATDPGGWIWEHDVRQVGASASMRNCTATTGSEDGWERASHGEHPREGAGSAGEFARVCACAWKLEHGLDDRPHRLLVRSCDHLGWQAEVRW